MPRPQRTPGLSHVEPSLELFIFLFGVGFGGNVPLMPAIRVEYFGRAAIGRIQGVMNLVMMFAGAMFFARPSTPPPQVALREALP